MPLCLIFQELMMERKNLETKVEQSERSIFMGVEPAFFGACLIIKALSWPKQYCMYIKIKLCFCSLHLCNLFVSIQLWKKRYHPLNKIITKIPFLGSTPVALTQHCKKSALSFFQFFPCHIAIHTICTETENPLCSLLFLLLPAMSNPHHGKEATSFMTVHSTVLECYSMQQQSPLPHPVEYHGSLHEPLNETYASEGKCCHHHTQWLSQQCNTPRYILDFSSITSSSYWIM